MASDVKPIMKITSALSPDILTGWRHTGC